MKTPTVKLHHVWDYTEVDRRFWQEHLESWLPERIFDAHVHINAPRYRRIEMTEEKKRQYWVNEVLEPIEAAELKRCYDTVFPHRKIQLLAMGFPSLEFDVETSNEDLWQECRKNGWFCLSVIRPQWPAEKVEQLLKDPSVLGVKVYYDLIDYDPHSRDKYIDCDILDFLPEHQLEILNQHKSWVVLHVPKKERLGHPENIRQIKKIRRKYPDIQLVIAHLGRNYTLAHAQESLPQLADDSGLLFDNSAVLNPEVHRYALELLGVERILYGTDNPIFFMRGRRQWQGKTYINRTCYPFYFNKDRESPEIESGYTLYMYEALKAIKDACTQLGVSRMDIERLFYGNADTIVKQVLTSKAR